MEGVAQEEVGLVGAAAGGEGLVEGGVEAAATAVDWEAQENCCTKHSNRPHLSLHYRNSLAQVPFYRSQCLYLPILRKKRWCLSDY